MLKIEKIPLGINANSYDLTSLSKLIAYDFEFHVFGDNTNIINNCIKFLHNHKKTIVVHYNKKITNEDIEFYNSKKIIVFLEDSLIPDNEIFIMYNIPKIQNLIVNFTNKISLHKLYKLIWYYKEYNKYYCGVLLDVNVIENIEELLYSMTQNKNTPAKDIIRTCIYKFHQINKFGFVIPYNKLFVSLKDNKIFLEDKIVNFNINDDYKLLFNINEQCNDCIATNFCEKYNIQNCNNVTKLYSLIIDILLKISEEL